MESESHRDNEKSNEEINVGIEQDQLITRDTWFSCLMQENSTYINDICLRVCIYICI